MIKPFLLLSLCALIEIKFVSSKYPSNGRIELRLENFAQFADESPVGGRPKVSNVERIRGIGWQLKAWISQASNGRKLLSNRIVIGFSDLSWSCAAKISFSITVGKNAVTFNEEGLFSKTARMLEFVKDIEELLELCRSNRSDVLILSAEIFAEAASGQAFPFNDSLLVKQHQEDQLGKLISVNKKLLALHSPFFDKLLFGTDQATSSSGTSVTHKPDIVQLDPPSTMEHFQQMVAVLIIGDIILNGFRVFIKNFLQNIIFDQNVENVLRLADRFMVDEVIGKCSHFLMNGKMPKLRSFHIAFNHNLPITKISILNSMGREDFCDGKNFMEIHNEMNRLGEEAQAEVYARYYELFPEAKKNNSKKARICE
ncbi:hypothetical protein niasHS_009355 [Heterodera schachtii]|uniref:BTB domain-containing protein n=2 Tax=Heterodera TaxID=34509 RepID=A0ABD2JBS5_HETSC